MHNPFAAWPITGTWADHMSYSLGGEDYPTPYGYAFEAPAAGTLRISGGFGEFRAGWVGSAGRRSILTLDSPIRDLVAVVFQHQSAFGREGRYDEGDPDCGYTGASANGSDWGGEVHMHWHGLNASGQRLRMSDYISSSTAGSNSRPITEGEDDMLRAIRNGDGSGSIGLVNDDGTLDGLTGEDYDALTRVGLLTGYHQEGDGTVWNILTARTARLRAHTDDVDEAAVAKQLAPLVIGPLMAALSGVGVSITPAQVQAAAEAAVRAVFADAGA